MPRTLIADRWVGLRRTYRGGDGHRSSGTSGRSSRINSADVAETFTPRSPIRRSARAGLLSGAPERSKPLSKSFNEWSAREQNAVPRSDSMAGLVGSQHGTRPDSRSLKMLKNPSKCESIDPTALKLHGEINTPFTVSHYLWVLNELGTRMVEDAANVVASSYGVRIVARKFGATARKAHVNPPDQVAMSRDRAVSAPLHQ